MTARGFALLAVLWAVTVLSGAVGVGAVAIRVGLKASQNRVVLAQAGWAADACAAIGQARWRAGEFTDSASVDLGGGIRCSWHAEELGARLNVNVMAETVLRRMMQQVGIPADSINRFLSILLDRRAARRFWDLREVKDLPGFDARVAPLVTVDGRGTVNLSSAPVEVLGALPGMTGEATRVIVSQRSRGRGFANLDDLASQLSPSGRTELVAHYRDLARILRFQSTELIITATGWVDSYGTYPQVQIELLVAPLADRLAVLRRRVM